MSVYRSSDWRAFVAAMRANPEDRVTPLVAADWLDEPSVGKHDHATFIRGCVRMRELREILDECAKMDLHYTDPTRSGPEYELIDLIHRLRGLINPHIHEWTGGMLRKLYNPTAYDWPLGFLRLTRLLPLAEGSDRVTDHNAMRKFEALVVRQPIRRVLLEFPNMTFASPLYHCERLAERFMGIEFRCGDASAFISLEAQPA